jgi:hypothetical protein
MIFVMSFLNLLHLVHDLSLEHLGTFLSILFSIRDSLRYLIRNPLQLLHLTLALG